MPRIKPEAIVTKPYALALLDYAAGSVGAPTTISGHTECVSNIAVLLDGRIVSSSWDKTLKLWTSDSSVPVQTFNGHTGWVRCVAVLPNGRIVSGSDDGTLKFWSLDSSTPVQTIQAQDAVYALAVLPDGRIVSGGPNDYTLKLWIEGSSTPVQVFSGHTSHVYCISVLPDGRIVSGSNDYTVRLWTPGSSTPVQTFSGHTDNVYCVAGLPDGRIVSGSSDKTLKLWIPGSSVPQRTFNGHWSAVHSVTVLPDGHILSGSNDHTLKLWTPDSSVPVWTLKHTSQVNSIAVLPDGRIVGASHNKIITVWGFPTLSSSFEFTEKIDKKITQDADIIINTEVPASSFPIIEVEGENYRPKLNEFIRKILYKKAVQDADVIINTERNVINGLKWVHIAAWYGDIKALKLLQEEGANIVPSEHGYTLLHCAATNGFSEMIEYLLDLSKAIELNAQTNDTGQTALHIAAARGNLHIVKQLVSKGASLRLIDKEKNTPALAAEVNKHNAIAQWINEQDMLLAVRQDDVVQVDSLTLKKIPLTLIDDNKLPLLLIATLSNSQKVVNFLLKRRLTEKECEATDAEGNTAIHIAAALGHNNLISILTPSLQINQLNPKNNQTPLHLAILNGQITFAKKLISFTETKLELVASVVINGELFEMMPMQIAVALGDNALIDALFKSKRIDYTQEHPILGSLLHIAVRFNQYNTLDKLLGEYATYFSQFSMAHLVETRDRRGLTPLNLAAQLGYTDMIEMLHKKHTANLYTQDKQGNSPAHWAALRGHESVIWKLCRLVQNKDVLKKEDENQDTPFHVAKDKRLKNLIKSLVSDNCQGITDTQEPWIYENLVFQGGGPKGIAYVGALEEYQKRFSSPLRDALGDVQRVAGTSAGAITAALVALNVTPEKIRQILSLTDLKAFVGGQEFKSVWTLDGMRAFIKNAYALSQKTGLVDGETFRLWMETQIKDSLGSDYKKNMTLGDLANLKKAGKPYKHLFVIGTHVNDASGTARMEIFSSENDSMKDYIISDIIRISMSIPGVFTPHQIHFRNNKNERKPYSDGLYVDGGIVNNFPITIFDNPKYQQAHSTGDTPLLFNKKTLGFSLLSPDEINRFKTEYGENAQQKSENGYDILSAVLSTVYNNELAHFNEADLTRTIFINSKGIKLTDFSLSEAKKQELIVSGQTAIKEFCAQNEGLCRPQYDCSADLPHMDIDAPAGSSFIPGAGAVSMQEFFVTSQTAPFFSFRSENSLITLQEYFDQDALYALEKPLDNLSHLLFDRWHLDSEKTLHADGTPTFNYRFFKQEQEVGSIRLYKHPLLCRSETGDRHNILELTGVLSNQRIDSSKLENVCAALPPTPVEQFIAQARHPAQHGATRGIANTVGYALEQTGYSDTIANISKEAVYYGGCFMLSFYEHYTQTQEVTSATYQAAAHIGALLFTNTLLHKTREWSAWLGQKASDAEWTKTGQALGAVSDYAGYGRYAYNGYAHGITDTATQMIVGGVVEKVVETVGVAGVDGLLFAYGASSKKHASTLPAKSEAHRTEIRI